MIRKLLVAMFIIGAAFSSTGCWEEALGYTCSGIGTCDDPKYCCDIDYYDWDCWYVADGRSFSCNTYTESCSDAWDAMADYCGYYY